jgi:hypothetical protein
LCMSKSTCYLLAILLSVMHDNKLCHQHLAVETAPLFSDINLPTHLKYGKRNQQKVQLERRA